MDAINAAVLYEKYRLSRLRHLRILDTEPEERFDRITRIARETFGAEIALVSLIDEHRQWFKSRQGIDTVSTPRRDSICDYAIRQEDVFVVEDALADARFAKNPLVTGGPGMRFYAGAPIREPGGFKIGTLCIVDSKPRTFNHEDLSFLRDLAHLVEAELERDVYGESGVGVLEPGALNRSLRICQQQLSRSVSVQQKLSFIVDQLMSLTGSSGGFVLDAWKMVEGQLPAATGVRVPVGAAGDIPLWRSLSQGNVDFYQIEALINGEYCAHAAGYPLLSGTAFRGFVVLLGRANAYPGSLNYELSPLLQLAQVVMERESFFLPHPDKIREVQESRAYSDSRACLDRRDLHRLVAQELKRANLRGGSLSVCLMDVDDFRRVNEVHGRDIADRVLSQIDARLRRAIRKDDVLAAAGGDEFALLLRDVSANATYARILEIFKQPFVGVIGDIELTGSMGVSVYPLDPLDSETILRHAEQAMCLAKEEGRGRFKLFDVQKFRLQEERIALVRELERALENEEFELFLQPKICLITQQVQGFEGLIRWHHPDRGTLTPDHFLPAIESSPLEGKLGSFVLRSGMDLLESFRAKGLEYCLSVNLSPSHFLNENFIPDLEDLLSQYSAEARSGLTLEILETTNWDDQDAAARVVRACKQLGLRVSLDDFGTGFSSLSYFRKLPLDEIKIDKSFVMDMMDQPEDQVIVESIISLSNQFGRTVVAEGIESEMVARRLAQMGCHTGQGYFYSRPLNPSKALAWAESFVGPRKDSAVFGASLYSIAAHKRMKGG